MRTRFHKFDARSQRNVVSLAAAVLLLLGGALSWRVHEGRRAAAAALAQSADAVATMDALLARYAALQQERGTDAGITGEDIAARVNRTLQGKRFQPTRIQQGADGELQVRLDAVVFADALAWLTELESTRGLSIRAVTVSQGPAGSANLTLVLRGG